MPSSRRDRALAVLEDVRKVIRSRMGGQRFVMHGPWPYTDEGMQQIVNTFCHLFDQTIRQRQETRAYLRQPLAIPLEDSQFENHLRAYLFDISNAPDRRPDVTTWKPRLEDDTRPGGYAGGHQMPGVAGVSSS
jgi:hypothetical protein